MRALCCHHRLIKSPHAAAIYASVPEPIVPDLIIRGSKLINQIDGCVRWKLPHCGKFFHTTINVANAWLEIGTFVNMANRYIKIEKNNRPDLDIVPWQNLSHSLEKKNLNILSTYHALSTLVPFWNRNGHKCVGQSLLTNAEIIDTVVMQPPGHRTISQYRYHNNQPIITGLMNEHLINILSRYQRFNFYSRVRSRSRQRNFFSRYHLLSAACDVWKHFWKNNHVIF